MKSVSRLVRHIKIYGLQRTIQKFLWIIATQSKVVEDVTARKRDLNKILDANFNSTIRYGPLRGYRFPKETWWSFPDRASMLLGLYEQEVLGEITKASEERGIFVDIGAAEGYYGVACVSQGLIKRSICYEISEHGQAVIRAAAELNGVADLVTILGEAKSDSLNALKGLDMTDTIILIDIEGAEFEVLDENVLTLMRGAVVIIELHIDSGERSVAMERLADRASKIFDINVIRTGPRDPAAFEELALMKDSDRWLICSEFRARVGLWWKLMPKQTSAAGDAILSSDGTTASKAVRHSWAGP